MQNEALDFVICNKAQHNCHHPVNQKAKIVLKQLVSCFIYLLIKMGFGTALQK